MTLKQAKGIVQKDDASYQEIHDASLAFRRAFKRNKMVYYLDYYKHCMDYRVDYELKTDRLKIDTCEYIYNHMKAGKEIDGIQLNDAIYRKMIECMSKDLTDTRVKIKTRSKRLSQIEYIRSCIKEDV